MRRIPRVLLVAVVSGCGTAPVRDAGVKDAGVDAGNSDAGLDAGASDAGDQDGGIDAGSCCPIAGVACQPGCIVPDGGDVYSCCAV